jgi:hypothetical protein
LGSLPLFRIRPFEPLKGNVAFMTHFERKIRVWIASFSPRHRNLNHNLTPNPVSASPLGGANSVEPHFISFTPWNLEILWSLEPGAWDFHPLLLVLGLELGVSGPTRVLSCSKMFFEQTRASRRLITMQKFFKIFVAKTISFVTFAHSFDR